jgi:hypothetical protein
VKKEKIQINKARNEKDITTDSIEIRDYCE